MKDYMIAMSKADHTQVRYMVQVDRDHLAVDVAERLREQGLAIERVLPLTRTVGGTGPMNLKARMFGVPGVARIREEGSFDLPPFNSNVPQ